MVFNAFLIIDFVHQLDQNSDFKKRMFLFWDKYFILNYASNKKYFHYGQFPKIKQKCNYNVIEEKGFGKYLKKDLKI